MEVASRSAMRVDCTTSYIPFDFGHFPQLIVFWIKKSLVFLVSKDILQSTNLQKAQLHSSKAVTLVTKNIIKLPRGPNIFHLVGQNSRISHFLTGNVSPPRLQLLHVSRVIVARGSSILFILTCSMQYQYSAMYIQAKFKMQ